MREHLEFSNIKRVAICIYPVFVHSSEFRSVSALCSYIQVSSNQYQSYVGTFKCVSISRSTSPVFVHSVSSDQYQSRVCTCYYRNIRRNLTEMRLSLLRWTLIIWFSFHTMRALHAGAAPQPTTTRRRTRINLVHSDYTLWNCCFYLTTSSSASRSPPRRPFINKAAEFKSLL